MRRRLLLALGTTPAASIDPDWLQSPLVDVAALFEGLTEDGRQRLLRLFLTTGASLLGRGGRRASPRAARGLLALLGVRRLDPLGWCPDRHGRRASSATACPTGSRPPASARSSP